MEKERNEEEKGCIKKINNATAEKKHYVPRATRIMRPIGLHVI